MAVVIRLMRAGAKKRPFYRIVVADSRRQRDGRFVEILGYYDPMKQPHELVFEKDRVEGWLKTGAQPSTQVASLLRSQGMTWGSASKPKRKAEGAAKAGTRAAKRKPRKISERKARAKAVRKAGKKKPATKTARKK
jgi:small subunit ribosomal protein S16